METPRDQDAIVKVMRTLEQHLQKKSVKVDYRDKIDKARQIADFVKSTLKQSKFRRFVRDCLKISKMAKVFQRYHDRDSSAQWFRNDRLMRDTVKGIREDINLNLAKQLRASML